MDKSEIMNIFKKRLKDLRNEKGLSQDKLADDLGVSKGAISYYETGQRAPDIVVLSAMADYFKVSADYLLGRTEVKSADTKTRDICDYLDLSDNSIFALKNISLMKTLDDNGKKINISDWVIQNILPEICIDVSEMLLYSTLRKNSDITASYIIYSLIVRSSDKYKYRLDEYIGDYFKKIGIDNYKSVFDFKDEIVFKSNE